MLEKSIRLGVILLLAMVLVVTGCGPATPEQTAEPEATVEEVEAEPVPEQRSVAMVLPGAIGDQGWNTKAYLALQEYEKQGYETAYVDEVPDADNESYLRSYAEQGYDLIVGHGFTFVDQAMKVGLEYPDSSFFVTAGLPPEGEDLPPNVSFMQYKAEQGCYLAGMLAGLMTETNIIGYVGAQSTPICLADLAAYKLGAREVNPDVEIMTVWVGVWADPAKGKETALTLIDNGADVLIHDADLTGTGALQAGKERGVYVIGMIDDQSEIAPDLFLTSVLVDVSKAIASQMDFVETGTFGGVWKPGIADDIVGIAPFGPAVPDDVAEQILERQQEIADGAFEVPSIYEEID
jgi:basic membrane protein A